MNLLKISMLGLGLVMMGGMACSSTNKSDTGPIHFAGTPATGGTIATGGTVATGGIVAEDAGVDVSTTPPADAKADVGGGACVSTKEGHLAIINAPTTGGLDVPGPTPPAYQTCK
jgi:hypothetical protein